VALGARGPSRADATESYGLAIVPLPNRPTSTEISGSSAQEPTMTTFTDAAASPPIAPFRVHYLDSPRDFSSVPLKHETARPVVAALVVVVVVAAAIGAIFAAVMLSL